MLRKHIRDIRHEENSRNSVITEKSQLKAKYSSDIFRSKIKKLASTYSSKAMAVAEAKSIDAELAFLRQSMEQEESEWNNSKQSISAALKRSPPKGEANVSRQFLQEFQQRQREQEEALLLETQSLKHSLSYLAKQQSTKMTRPMSASASVPARSKKKEVSAVVDMPSSSNKPGLTIQTDYLTPAVHTSSSAAALKRTVSFVPTNAEREPETSYRHTTQDRSYSIAESVSESIWNSLPATETQLPQMMETDGDRQLDIQTKQQRQQERQVLITDLLHRLVSNRKQAEEQMDEIHRRGWNVM